MDHCFKGQSSHTYNGNVAIPLGALQVGEFKYQQDIQVT
jgi:hypothetical protein